MIDPWRQSVRREPPRHLCSPGFTLIEVLIVVAIVGILASIAYPSYGEYVKRARRSDGHLALLEQRQALERCRATSYTYVGCTVTSATSSEGYYAITMAAPTASAFTIVATATGTQAGDTDCAKLTIDERDRTLGFKTGDVANADCW